MQMLTILDCVTAIRNEAALMFQSCDVRNAGDRGVGVAEDEQPSDRDRRRAGRSSRSRAVYTGWVNAAGLPALALPVEPAPDGRQIGVQLVAAFGAYCLLLALGDAIVSRGEAFGSSPPWLAPRRITGSR